MRVELHPEARAELIRAALWYEEQRPRLGDEFGAAVAAMLAQVGRAPVPLAMVLKSPESPDALSRCSARGSLHALQEDAVNQAADEKLRALRQRLAALEPYPWESIEAWIATARPLIRACYREHFDDFASVASTPRWCQLPRFVSGDDRWGEPQYDNFDEAAATEEHEDRKIAAAAKGRLLAFIDGLLDLPPLPAQTPHPLAGIARDQRAAYYHQGDVIVSGSKFNTNVTDSNVGAFAQGDHATATGNVTLSASGHLSQEHHKAAIKDAQSALVRDQDALEQIDERLYEALNQFLIMARKIQVDQQSLADVQAKMKDTLDEVWAEQAAKGLRPQVLPKTLEVAEALIKNPAMGEVVKKLLGA